MIRDYEKSCEVFKALVDAFFSPRMYAKFLPYEAIPTYYIELDAMDITLWDQKRMQKLLNLCDELEVSYSENTFSIIECGIKYKGIYPCQRPRGHSAKIKHLHTSESDGRSVEW